MSDATSEELEAAVREELAFAWRRCMAYIAQGSTPVADPQGEGAVRRILRAADRHAAEAATGASRLALEAADAQQRLQAATAERLGRA